MMRGSGFVVIKWKLSGRFRPQLGHAVGPGTPAMCQLIPLWWVLMPVEYLERQWTFPHPSLS